MEMSKKEQGGSSSSGPEPETVHPLPGSHFIQSKEAPCVFSFEPDHLTAVAMRTDTNTVHSSNTTMRTNSTFFPPSGYPQPQGSIPGCNGASPWISQFGQHGSPSMNRSMFPSLPNRMPTYPHNVRMFSPPHAVHDHVYMQQMYPLPNMQMMRPMEGYPAPQRPHSNMLIHHPPGTPPLWGPSSPPSRERPRTNEQSSPVYMLRALERTPAPALQGYYQSSALNESARRIYRVDQQWAQQTQQQSNIVRPVPLYANQQKSCSEVNLTPQCGTGEASNDPPVSSQVQAEVSNDDAAALHRTQETTPTSTTAVPEKTQETISTCMPTEKYKEPISSDAQRSEAPVTPLPFSRPIKKRSVIDDDTAVLLEADFQNNKSPNQLEIARIAERYHLTKGAVRSWFSSRRQRQKRLERETGMAKQKRTCRESGSLKVPSQTYDITVEVPSINPRDRGSVVHQDYQGK